MTIWMVEAVGLNVIDSLISSRASVSLSSALYYYTRAQTLRAMGRKEESVRDAKKAQSLGYSVPAEYLQ